MEERTYLRFETLTHLVACEVDVRIGFPKERVDGSQRASAWQLTVANRRSCIFLF